MLLELFPDFMPKHHDHQLPELEPWKYPRDYIGEDYTGYLVVGIGRNRDSGPLENSNYETALAELKIGRAHV